MLAFTRRLGVESALALASYGADHLKLLMYYQMLPWITVVADLRNFTVVALKCLSLGNSRQLNLSSLHTPWQLLHECSLSIWKCWLIKEDRFFFFCHQTWKPSVPSVAPWMSPQCVQLLCGQWCQTGFRLGMSSWGPLSVDWNLTKISATPFYSSLKCFTSIWRRQVDPYMSSCIKLKYKWIKDFNINSETLTW